MRLRLLPAMITVTAALLAGKTVGLGLALMPAAVVTAAAAAPAHDDAPKPAAAAKPPDAPPRPAEPVARPGSPEDGGPAGMPSPAPQAEAVSASERALLQELRARRRELDIRAQALETRESVLAAAEQKLNDRVSQLTALQGRLEALDQERRAHDEANWAGLVKTYETMKPREAATIFNDMDMGVLLAVLDRMKDAKAAAVLGAMQPDRARQATAQLAAQRTRSVTVPPAPAG